MKGAVPTPKAPPLTEQQCANARLARAVSHARRTVLAAVEALTDKELMRLAREIRDGQTSPLLGRNRVEICGASKPLVLMDEAAP